MAKRMVLMLLVVGLFFGGVFGWKAFVGNQARVAMAERGPPVATVSTAKVLADDWIPLLRSVATLRSAQSVDVTAQVRGQVTRLYFDSGDAVEPGTPLVQQYVADDQAQLKALQADLRLAEIELGRIEQLVREKLVPLSERDAAISRLDRVRAEVESLEVAIGKKSIRAPFAGRLGIRRVNLGQFIEPGDAIVRLEALDRLYADFKVPQQALPVVAVDQAVTVTVDAWPGKAFTGEITAIEPGVTQPPATCRCGRKSSIRTGGFGPVCSPRFRCRCRNVARFCWCRRQPSVSVPLATRFMSWKVPLRPPSPGTSM